MTEVIDLTPVTNDERIRAYAERHKTERPWDHITGQLVALGGLAEELRELGEEHSGDELAWAFVRAFESRHSVVSTEFMRFFGSEPQTASQD